MRQLLYEITHTTGYEYRGMVSVSHHLLRLAPRELPRQRCLFHEFEIHPRPSVLNPHGDYFGNLTHFIAVEQSHGSLEVTSRCRVAVAPAFIPEASETPGWESVRSRCRSDHSRASLEAHEHTYASPLVPTSAEFAAYAHPSFTPGRPILEAVADFMARVHKEFRFDPSATNVTTPVHEVFRHRRGVCQDFAHFLIACLRSLGLPARYVSGYLETDPPPGQTKLRGVDASHAWVSFFCPGMGWVDVDPTNNCFPSLRHVTIGWGRDYADICPVRGVLVGGQDQTLRVSVDVSAVGTLDDPLPVDDLHDDAFTAESPSSGGV